MDVKDRLACAGSNVVNRSVAILDSALASDLRSSKLAISQNLSVLRLCLFEASNVLFGNDQDVSRRLRLDVFKGEHPVIFKHLLGGDFSGDHLAKKTVRISHFSS